MIAPVAAHRKSLILAVTAGETPKTAIFAITNSLKPPQ
jgi:hypothetical protein